MRIHHATVSKAKKFKIELTIDDGEIVASRNGVRLASGLMGNVVLEQAIAKLGGEKPDVRKAHAKLTSKPRRAKPAVDEGGGDEDGQDDTVEAEGDDEGQALGSIVKPKYRQRYKPHKGTCGDDLAFKVREHLMVENDAGEMRIDKAAMRKFAEANGCWDKKYADVNNGVARMSVTNRLRAKVRKGHAVVWK